MVVVVRGQIHMTTIRPARQLSHESSLRLWPTKTRLHWAQEGLLLTQRTRHAEVLVRRETGLMMMVASGVSVGLVHSPAVFIVAVRVHLSTGGRAVSDEFS